MSEQKSTISRRKFVTSLGMVAAALPLGASAFDFIPSEGKGFSFMMLGDIHFTHEDFHDLEYVKTKFSEGDVTQVHNYSRISRENLQPLLSKTKEVGKKLNSDFYLQLGDFVEGLCGSEELATKQTNGFISLVKQQDLGRPFFVIKGNHDITGTGAQETFKNVVLPWQTTEQVKPLSSANSTFVHKGARFILFDGYTPDESLVWLKDVLANSKEKTVFFCVHQPVVPFSARSNWHVFAKPSQQKQREELLNLLGQYKAIVLCGHLHKTSILTRTTPTGRFVQICTGSVIEHPDAPIKDHLEGLDAYGVSLLNLEPKFAPTSLEERKVNLENEKPFIKSFEYADFMGYSTVTVSPKNKVQVSIFRNMDNNPWKVVDVDQLFTA
ncbi:MAG TPA: metallophosphoesterase family protein [Flavisolibacter sp.]|nr:metallophosphoesterase family protein [Flavisolibacter sp.]